MKAVSFTRHLAISDPDALLDLEAPRPALRARDLLVAVRAISVNPVDTKIRAGFGPRRPGTPLRLGWDAAGVVLETGPDATRFKPGDEVYYAGTIDRDGTYAEFHAVDERLVGRKPATLSFAEAAALPLTTITAWEMLFDRLKLARDPATRGSLLVIGGAGGVGSVAIQLARRLTGLTVIATASRPDSRDWCLALGAHHVIDHRQPLSVQVKAIVPGGVNHVLGLTKTEEHYEQIIDALAPMGALVLIENVARPLDLNLLKPKCLSLHWEFMFARALFQTPDMAEQGRLLDEVAALADRGELRSTLSRELTPINAANLRQAHTQVESGRTIGKLALSGW